MSATPADAPDPRGMTGLVGWLAAGLLRVLGATWRVRTSGPDPFSAGHTPVLGALLHRDFLIAAWLFRDRGIRVGVSRSRDGELIDRVLGALGYAEAARGSSSRGGAVAQLSLLRSLQAGRSVAVVVDGPRGPAGRPKPGVVRLAQHTRRPITPVSFHARFAWRFGSWDATCLPLPFARVECRYAAPIVVRAHEDDGRGAPRRAGADDEAAALELLASRLARSHER